MAGQKYQAFCLQCLGGGKTLKIGSKRECEREATSHGNMHGHQVALLPIPAKTKVQKNPRRTAAQKRKQQARLWRGRVAPRKNPRRNIKVSSEILAQANKLYEGFTGDTLTRGKVVNVPEPAKVLVRIGTIDGLLYTTLRDGKTERYIHEFKRKARPTFAVTPDGKQLYLLGGAYNFTDRGIVDKR